MPIKIFPGVEVICEPQDLWFGCYWKREPWGDLTVFLGGPVIVTRVRVSTVSQAVTAPFRGVKRALRSAVRLAGKVKREVAWNWL